MRRLVVVAALVLLAAVFYRLFGNAETGTGTLTLPQPYPNVGSAAPTFTAPSEEGGDFSLTDRGTYVLAFWSTLNRQSNRARPEFERLAREFSKEGVEFAVVYVNSAPDRASADYEVLQDRSGSLTQSYNVKRVPRVFLVTDGRVEFVQTGYYGDRDLRTYLEDHPPDEQARKPGAPTGGRTTADRLN